MKPTIGRIVHFVIEPDFTGTPQHRPAMIVRVFNGGHVNLVVFLDGSNDIRPHSQGLMEWRTSAMHDEEIKAVNTWHWPEREDQP